MSRHAPPSSPVRKAVVAGVAVIGLTVFTAERFASNDTSVASALRDSGNMPSSTAEGRTLPIPERPTTYALDTADPATTAPARSSVAAATGHPQAASTDPGLAVDEPRPVPRMGGVPSSPPVGEAGGAGPSPEEPEAPDVAREEPSAVTPKPDPVIALGMPEILNRERLAHGCGPVAIDPALQTFAESHSVAQGHKGAVYHSEGPDGFDSWAENVAAGQGSAAQVVAEWMASPDHRVNILNCDYTVIGSGSADGYWTLVLAS